MNQLVIPMAGLGQRFKDAGYSIPKPLIPIGGVPMVVRVVNNLPRADRTVFICHADHLRDYPMAKVLTDTVPGAKIVMTPGLTEGQACSTALALDDLDVNAPVLVAACDSTQVYDRNRWNALISDPSIDAVIWTFRNDPRVLLKPTAWGWVEEVNGVVRQVSVKKPLSETPIRDGAVTGTFWFRSAGLMAEGIMRLVAENRRINNEFYLDSVPNVLLEAGYTVLTFDVQKYIGWGTPDDYEDYRRWEQHFAPRRVA
jgi:NDP-sugar pyrophosphorylase family protein